MKLQSDNFLGTRQLTRVFSTALMLVCATSSFAAPTWDIVGLKLGMTEKEARAAIKAHSTQATIDEKTLKFTFSDGAKQQETPSFLSTIQVHIPGPPGTLDNERLKLEFSAPPLEQRLIGVRRELTSYKNPPPLDRLRDSLTQKYGKPLDYASFGIGLKSDIAKWAETGKALCGGEKFFFPGVSQSPNDLKKFYQWQSQKLAPADLSKCSAQLMAKMDYQQGGSSVTALVVEMNDYGYILPALEATAKWLADKEAAARQQRLNSGTIPKL